MLSKYSEGLKNSEEHLSNAVIATYINLKYNLSEKEISFIENHICKCDECRKRLDGMIEEDLELGEVVMTHKIKKRNTFYVWATAATIIIAAGIGIYYYLLSPKQVIVENNKSLIDSLSLKENTQIIKESRKKEETNKYNQADFTANNILENFVNRNVRSESSVKIISPQIGDTLSVPINFKWENKKSNYIFELVNNGNKFISKQALTDNHLIYKEKLNPGLYYWKILVDDKLEVVGKFYIK